MVAARRGEGFSQRFASSIPNQKQSPSASAGNMQAVLRGRRRPGCENEQVPERCTNLGGPHRPLEQGQQLPLGSLPELKTLSHGGMRMPVDGERAQVNLGGGAGNGWWLWL